MYWFLSDWHTCSILYAFRVRLPCGICVYLDIGSEQGSSSPWKKKEIIIDDAMRCCKQLLLGSEDPNIYLLVYRN